MEVHEEMIGDALVLVPVDRVDSATAKVFEAKVIAAIGQGTGKIVLDFSQLDYISSAGLRVVLVGAKMTRAPRKFVLSDMKPHIREIFDMSGFSKILVIHPDRAAALAS